MEKVVKLLRLFLVLSTTLLPLSACALSGGPVAGQVLEEGTQRPIPGVYVVVRWRGELPEFADSRMVCYHVASAMTDESGRYQIPAWSKEVEKDWQKRIINKRFIVTAYKAGFGLPEKPSQKQEIVLMAPFKRPAGERLDFLVRVFGTAGCGSGGESDKNSIPFMRAVYGEALDLGQSIEKKRMVESFLYSIEKLELGFEQAEKRHLERVGK